MRIELSSIIAGLYLIEVLTTLVEQAEADDLLISSSDTMLHLFQVHPHIFLGCL
jgi:hypothetical protein